MALHWDISHIKDYEDLCLEDAGLDSEGDEQVRLNPTTDNLIWATMSTGIGEITDDTYIEFWIRMNTLSTLQAGTLGGAVKVMPLDAVKAHIGLSTNVSHEAPGKWFKRIVKSETQSIQYREEKREKKNARAAAIQA
jgi:hypothetical protein